MRAGIKTVFFLLALIALPGAVWAQKTQGISSTRRSIESILGLPPEDHGKCGTSALVLALSRWHQLTRETQDAILKVLQRPSMQKSRLSPTKKFRIHYDTIGANTPALVTGGTNPQRIANSYEQFVDSVAFFFERAWNLEVDSLGYLAPPSDGTEGGGPEYDVYVEALGLNFFGLTNWDASSPIVSGVRETFASYAEVHNDFLGFRTPGMQGLCITAAHEFHHAIQVGNYGIWSSSPNSDFYFYELTSVWMEHLAYPDIHDYYFDLPLYFEQFRDSQNRALSFSTYNSRYQGYERSIWAQFLAKRFGRGIMHDIWQGIISSPVLASMENALLARNTTLESEFSLFGTWNYYTADRADPQHFYDDGAHFPRFAPNSTTPYGGLTSSLSTSGAAMSTQFLEFTLPTDTLTAIVSNTNIAGATQTPVPLASFELDLSAGIAQPPFQNVGHGLNMRFSAADLSQWRTVYLLSSTRGTASTATNASPNPLRVASDSRLVLPVGGSGSVQADVFLLNSALELVFSRLYTVRSEFGRGYIDIPTSDLRSIHSGIYFVVAKVGDAELKWKIALIQ